MTPLQDLPESPALPEDLSRLLSPLFEALPLRRAMQSLVLRGPTQNPMRELAQDLAALPELLSRPHLLAGIWLYIDELDRSHHVSQSLDDAAGSYWHAIMHRREGDFSNAKYWLRRASHLPIAPDADPAAFVDAVARSGSTEPPELLQRQRREWQTLFEWCAAQPTYGEEN
jgi:hypothetical protein